MIWGGAGPCDIQIQEFRPLCTPYFTKLAISQLIMVRFEKLKIWQAQYFGTYRSDVTMTSRVTSRTRWRHARTWRHRPSYWVECDLETSPWRHRQLHRGGGQIGGGSIAISGTAQQIWLIFCMHIDMTQYSTHNEICRHQPNSCNFGRFFHYHGNRFGINPTSRFQCSCRPKNYPPAKLCWNRTSRSWDPALLTLEDYYIWYEIRTWHQIHYEAIRKLKPVTCFKWDVTRET